MREERGGGGGGGGGSSGVVVVKESGYKNRLRREIGQHFFNFFNFFFEAGRNESVAEEES